jgi:hypothetical protein
MHIQDCSSVLRWRSRCFDNPWIQYSLYEERHPDIVSADFLSKPEDIAQALKGKIKSVDTVFFYSYLQPKPKPGSGAWSNAQELVDVNGALLDNFLNALPLAELKPNRVLLQTGAKNYGVHLGRARAPYVESDPRVTLEPNFYYPQCVYLARRLDLY